MSGRTVDILVFEVGNARFGADASQVLRVDSPLEAESVGAPLGKVKRGKRALVFHDASGEQRRLQIDLVHGIKTVSIELLRRLPEPARAGRANIGAWLDGDRAVVLVDLVAMT